MEDSEDPDVEPVKPFASTVPTWSTGASTLKDG